MKRTMIGGAIAVMASAALAQQMAGTEADQTYAAQLWEMMVEADLAGENRVHAYPYAGTDPHGMMLETFYSEATVDGHTGVLVVKNNYGPQGVTADEVIASPDAHLGSVTIMFQREEGYDPETNNWFWAKYLPDGTLDQNPAGMALAGLVGKNADAGCIACHQGAGGDDYLFTTDADLTVD